MDMRDLLSPETRTRLEAERAIVDGMYRMPDAFLGHALLRSARQARREAPEDLGNPARFSYDINLVWQVIPVIATRLGAGPLQPNEGTDPNFVTMDARELRLATGNYLRNAGLDGLGERYRPDASKPCALDVLGREFVNGNPIAIAIDRLSPPSPDADNAADWLARHMHEIGMARFGHGRFLAWEPAFQDWKTRSGPEEDPAEDAAPGM